MNDVQRRLKKSYLKLKNINLKDVEEVDFINLHTFKKPQYLYEEDDLYNYRFL